VKTEDDAWDFTEFNGVQQKGCVTVPGEPLAQTREHGGKQRE
jgi:hypothetical protein